MFPPNHRLDKCQGLREVIDRNQRIGIRVSFAAWLRVRIRGAVLCIAYFC
jgi:hypothetical protein